MKLRASILQRIGFCLALTMLFLTPSTLQASCAEKADADPTYAKFPGGHAIWLPGIGKDFVFTDPPGFFVENSDGTARLTGTVRRTSNSTEAFAVDITFSGWTETASDGSPHLELKSPAYASNGGPIDPATWYYYPTWSGVLTGIDDYAGAVVEIDRRGAPFQVGVGANGKNLGYGASGWLDYTVTQQPDAGSLQSSGDGDVNIDLGDCPPSAELCVLEAISDENNPNAAYNHALYLPGISKKLIFQPPAQWLEFPDGTARLVGTAVDRYNSRKVFDVVVELTGRTSTPPAGSPDLGLDPGAYVSGGGAVDPATWIYYESFAGTLVGREQYEGAVVEFSGSSPAWQNGIGANGTNAHFGASSTFDWDVVEHPTSSSALPETGTGSFSVDLGPGCLALLPPGGTGKLGDLVWNDLDRDGVFDDGEPVLPGVIVRLYRDGVLSDVLRTNSSGLYFFKYLPVGSYQVVIETASLPEGLEPTHDRDGTGTPHNVSIALGPDERHYDVDFGYAEPPPPPPPAPEEPVRPILECVVDHGDGSYTAYFGYLNDNDVPVTIPVGSDNRFSPSPSDRGQPTEFQPGRTGYWPDAAFSVTWDGGNLVWTLDGRTSTASPNSTPCSNHVFVGKTWRDTQGQETTEPPAGLGPDFAIVVESDMGTATCTYPAGSVELQCEYDNDPPALDDNGLWVPVESTYTITEVNAPEGWSAEGTGTFEVAPETCAPGVAGLVKYCLHTLVNTQDEAQPGPIFHSDFDTGMSGWGVKYGN